MEARLYSPTQVALCSFLGGPPAMLFVLRNNFAALNDTSGARKALVGGLLLILLSVALPLWLMPHFFVFIVYLLPFVYALTATMISVKYHIGKPSDTAMALRSYRNVLGVIIVGFSITLLFAVVLPIILISMIVAPTH